MRISSATNNTTALLRSTQNNSTQKSDGISEGIKKQIENIKEQISNVSKIETLSPKEKMVKRQELQDMLQDLNNQLSQRQMEIRKEALEKKAAEIENKDTDKIADSSTEGKTDTVSISDTSMSKTDMKNIISSEYSMTKLTVSNGIKTKLQGQSGILKEEIKLDRSKGVDTSSKSAKLSDIKGNIKTISIESAGNLSDINEKLQDGTQLEKIEKDDSLNEKDKLKNNLNDEDNSDTDALYDPNHTNEFFNIFDPVDIRF